MLFYIFIVWYFLHIVIKRGAILARKRTGVWVRRDRVHGREFGGIFDLDENIKIGDEFPYKDGIYRVEQIEREEDPENPGTIINVVTGMLKEKL